MGVKAFPRRALVIRRDTLLTEECQQFGGFVCLHNFCWIGGVHIPAIVMVSVKGQGSSAYQIQRRLNRDAKVGCWAPEVCNVLVSKLGRGEGTLMEARVRDPLPRSSWLRPSSLGIDSLNIRGHGRLKPRREADVFRECGTRCCRFRGRWW